MLLIPNVATELEIILRRSAEAIIVMLVYSLRSYCLFQVLTLRVQLKKPDEKRSKGREAVKIDVWVFFPWTAEL